MVGVVHFSDIQTRHGRCGALHIQARYLSRIASIAAPVCRVSHYIDSNVEINVALTQYYDTVIFLVQIKLV